MVNLMFALAFLSVLAVGCAIVATHVPYWLDAICLSWLDRHARRTVGGLTFFRLPNISGSIYIPRR